MRMTALWQLARQLRFGYQRIADDHVSPDGAIASHATNINRSRSLKSGKACFTRAVPIYDHCHYPLLPTDLSRWTFGSGATGCDLVTRTGGVYKTEAYKLRPAVMCEKLSDARPAPQGTHTNARFWTNLRRRGLRPRL